jgi:hypothetical protein
MDFQTENSCRFEKPHRCMKNKKKDFDTVKTFRAIKEKISKDIADMNLKQIQLYLKDKKVRTQS